MSAPGPPPLTRTAILTLLTAASCGWLRAVGSFNVDEASPQVVEGAKGSLFGYSVALWIDENGNQSLAVGAPRGTLSSAANKTFVLGNIYFCQPLAKGSEGQCSVREDIPMLSYQDCSQQAVHWAKNVYTTQGIGFGETIFTPKKPGAPLLVCAPRYPRKNEDSKTNITQLQTRGACFTISAKSPDEEKADFALPYPNYLLYNDKGDKVIAIRNDQSYAGFAQAGFSATMGEDGKTLYLGGPSAFSNQGVALAMRRSYGKWKRKRTSRVTYSNDVALEGNMEGWATALGTFDGATDYVATSLPRNNNYRGMVRIYRTTMKNVKRFVPGDEVGSWFGFSLAVGDFDGDKKDDLVVGAPFSTSGGLSHDYGKAFIYYAPVSNNNDARERSELVGREPWGRFGQSIVSPGDLDVDGYDDLAVGAPNAFGEKGLVVIYNGAESGIKVRPSQIIKASDFPASLRWFGFSLDGGFDFDGNGFPDLIVGAPGSDKALFLRSGPVVSLTGWIEFESPLISLDNTTCSVLLPDGIQQEVVCFNLVVYMQYEAKHTNESIPFVFNIEVDYFKKRVAFLDTHEHIHTMIQNVSHVSDVLKPLEFPVYVKPNVRRLKLEESVQASLKASLANELTKNSRQDSDHKSRESAESRQVYSNLTNVLSAYSQTTFKNQTEFECADINACISRSDLVLAANESDPLVVGDGTRGIEISLEVRRNTAYSVRLNMTAPSMLEYLRAESEDYLPECTLVGRISDENKFSCKFPSEIPKDAQVKLGFTFKYFTSKLLSHRDHNLHFAFTISSDSPDLELLDNSLEVSVPVISRVDIQAKGWSNPDSVTGRLNETLSGKYLIHPKYQANISQATPDQLGPEVTHQFILMNHGPSPLVWGKVILGLPLQVRHDLPLLYLINPIKTSQHLKCDEIVLNPLNLSIIHEGQEEGTNSTTIYEWDSPFSDDEGEEGAVEEEEEKEVSSSLRKGSEGDELEKEQEIPSNGTNKIRLRRSLPTPLEELPGSELPPEVVPQETSPPSSSNNPSEDYVSSFNASQGPRVPSNPALSNPTTRRTGKKKPEKINCDNVQCAEVECDISNLMADDVATIEITGYIAVGTLNLLNLNPIIVESSMAFYTSQGNVVLNDHPARQDLDESASLSEDAETIGDLGGEIRYEAIEDWGVPNAWNDTTEDSSTLETRDNIESTFKATTNEPLGTTTETLESASNLSTPEVKSTGDDIGNSSTTGATNTTENLSTLEEKVTPPGDLGIPGPADDTSAESDPRDITPSTQDGSILQSDWSHATNGAHATGRSEQSTFPTVKEEEEDEGDNEDEEEEKHEEEEEEEEDLDVGITKVTLTTPNTPDHPHLNAMKLILEEDPIVAPDAVTLADSADQDPDADSADRITESGRRENVTEAPRDAGEPGIKSTFRTRKYDEAAGTYITITKHTEVVINAETLMEIGFWKLILAVMGSLMLIIIICAILYKIGFFKRKRITAQEREELARSIRKREENEKYM